MFYRNFNNILIAGCKIDTSYSANFLPEPESFNCGLKQTQLKINFLNNLSEEEKHEPLT